MKFITFITIVGALAICEFIYSEDGITPERKIFDGLSSIDPDNNPEYRGVGIVISGLRSGRWMFFRKDGSIIAIREYTDRGVTNGQYIDFWENGSVFSLGQTRNGMDIGVSIGFYENGKPRFLVDYNLNPPKRINFSDKFTEEEQRSFNAEMLSRQLKSLQEKEKK